MSEIGKETEGNLIDVVRLKKYFPIRAGLLKRVVGQVRAVDDISFYIKKGETLGLVGESGCGKTTVGRSIIMLTPPTEGHVFHKAPREVVEQVTKIASLCKMDDSALQTSEKSLELTEALKSLTGIEACHFKQDDKKSICNKADKIRAEVLSSADRRSKMNLEDKMADGLLAGKARLYANLALMLGIIGIILIASFLSLQSLLGEALDFLAQQALAIVMLIIAGLLLFVVYLHVRNIRMLYAEEIADEKVREKLEELRHLADEAVDFVAKRYCINHMKKRDVLRMRSQIQFVFQDPFSSLNPRMLIKDIVSEPISAQMRLKKRTMETLFKASLLFIAVGISMICYSAFFLLPAGPIPDEWLRTVIPGMMLAIAAFLLIAGYLLSRIEWSGSLRDVLGARARRSEMIRKKTISLLEKVGLNVEHMYRFPHEFSGGQRQRIGIARALSVNPEFIVLDEPTSALDVSVQAQVLNMLNDLQNDFGLTYLFISHDLSTIRYMCDRVAVMYLGKIVEYAPKKELFSSPIHPYTEALLSVIPVPDPDMKRDRIILTGDVPSPANPPPGCRFHTRCPVAIQKCKEEEPPLIDRGNEHFVACHVR